MGTVGYAASMEQFAPSELLKYCQQAEGQGFTAVMASDHFNPWVPSQGQSGFVWASARVRRSTSTSWLTTGRRRQCGWNG